MPLVNIKPVLAEAKAQGYAVAAFNPVDYLSMRAMVGAAEEVNAPVIIQTSAKTINYYSHEALYAWMQDIAGDSPVPVVLHLDHGKDLDMIKKCIDTGQWEDAWQTETDLVEVSPYDRPADDEEELEGFENE